ncbi:putative NAD(P)-binding protein [Seiridium unicorne]|uniref:NAD(P)-binding protein n=1 Tax=Seiridium unicorne TaxID=138068 RepID=A0ABR2V646_9PEZI
MPSTQEIVLVTGVTRGIGAQLLDQLLARQNTKVIAAVRDLNAAATKRIVKQSQTNQNLIVVKIDSEVQTDPQNAARVVRDQHGIDHIDVIIANAGVAADWAPVLQIKPEDIQRSMNINVLASILLFQAFEPLLSKSANPRMLFVSTAGGSLSLAPQMPFHCATYGSSKAALNFIAVRIAIEHPAITSLTLHPGMVETDMATNAHAANKLDFAESGAISPEQSARAILKLADDAKVETHSGKFFDAQSGSELPW